jgi:thymidylate synthase (FAD)
MKIIKPYARMLPLPGWAVQSTGDTFTTNMGLALLKHIEWCARISHRSENAVTEDSWKRIIQNIVLDHGDWSVVEHASVSVDAYVDRGITHEWVRHRLFSYTQESTRFVNYKKKMEPGFVFPEELNATTTSGDENNSPNRNKDLAQMAWKQAIEKAEDSYQLILNCGYSPQIARSVFPNALASRIITTGNLRNWRHFFIMRTSKETHPQMKQVSIPLLKEFQEKIPLLFDDIIPETKQSIAMSKVR